MTLGVVLTRSLHNEFYSMFNQRYGYDVPPSEFRYLGSYEKLRIYNDKKYTPFYTKWCTHAVSKNRVASTVWVSCIKSCIDNVPLKKPQTLI